MAFERPQFLVSTEQLEHRLGEEKLRILDCTVFLRPPAGDSGAERARWVAESGRADYEKGHISGAVFADLVGELSDPDAPLPFTMPSADRFAAAMSKLGVGEGTRVVCYDANLSMWATRVWWMLRAFGFDSAAVLDGGWKKWSTEGRPVTTDLPTYLPGNFVARPRPQLIASKADVLAAVGDGATCVVNALTPEQHRGEGPNVYGRPGRIAGSVNVSARDIVDRETGAFLPAEELRKRFEGAGARQAERVITYCGGGIAATSDAFVLTLLGHDNVSVYDGSLSEWAADESLPMETG
ncbi:MAG: sulfurtransferase [Hyphomicrobiales bacterium]